MAKTTCKYHPTVPARWYCPGCAVNVCPQCVKAPGRRGGPPLCNTCQGELESLGIGNTITPFWERIPRFFAYPFKPDALTYLGMLSVASLGVFLPFFGIIIYLLVTFALLKYGYIVLNHTAQGNLSPPQLLANNVAADNNLPLRQLAVFLLMGVILLASSLLGSFGVLAALMFMLFTLPASVITLAITGSILQAINPGTLIGMVRAIGWPYGILYVFLLLLSGGSDMAAELIQPLLPIGLFVVVGVFLSGYFTVIMFNMMGYVVYQYHEPLGYDQVREFDSSEDRPATRAAPPVDPFLNEINILVTEGKLGEAKDRLQARLRLGGSAEERERYHALLKLSGDRQELVRHGEHYLRMLVELKQADQALDVLADCLEADPGFRVEGGSLAYSFAQTAHARGRHDLALNILNGFAKSYPKHAQLPQAYMLAAKILCEHKGQDAAARKVLNGLLRLYPNHEMVPEIKRYLDFIDRLGGGDKLATPA